MRKIAVMLSLIIVQGIALGADVCEGEGLSYGDGTGNDMISASCLMQIKESAGSKTKKQFSGGTTIFGHLDILYIEHENHQGRPLIIAGSSTRLTKILAIGLDEVNSEIAVLDQNGEVLFFSPQRTGNVTPLRVLKTAELVNITDVKILPEKGEVAVLKESERKVLIYSRLANFRARKEHRNLGRIRVLNIPASAEANSYFQDLK